MIKGTGHKRISLGIAAMLLALTAVGCAKQENGGVSASDKSSAAGTADATTKEEAKRVKLTWVAYNMLPGGKNEEILARWNEKYPNIEIEYKDFPVEPYFNTLDVALAANETMDVMLMSPGYISTRAQQGAFLELDSFAKSDNFDLQDNFGDILKKVQVNGQNYLLPYTKNIEMLYYNKDLFDAKGLKYPDENTTYDELADMAKKLTQGQGNDKVWGLMLGDSLSLANNAGWTWLKDQYTPNVNDPRMKKTLELNKDLFDSGASPSTIQVEQEKLSSRLLFAQGKVAMITTDWWAPVFWSIQRYNNGTMGDEALKFNYDVTYLPRYDTAGKPKLYDVMGDWGYVVNAKTKHPKESYLFAKFLSTEIFDILGVIPAYNKSDENLFDNIYNVFIDKNKVKHTDLFPKEFVDKMKQIIDQTVPLSTEFDSFPMDSAVLTSTHDIYNREIDQYYLGKIGIDEVLAKIQTQAEKEAAKLKN